VLKSLLPLACSLFLAQPALAALGAASLQPNDRVVIAGDSIVQLGQNDPEGPGFWYLFTQSAGNAVPGSLYWNSGVPGNTSKDLAQRFYSTVLNVNPSVVIIQIGINDIDQLAFERYNPHQLHLNLEYMINACLASGVREIVLTSPMGRFEHQDGSNPSSVQYDEAIDRYSRFLYDIARDDTSGRIYYCPLRGYFLLEEARINPLGASNVLMRPDGLHQNKNGEQFLYQVYMTEFGFQHGVLPSP